MEYHMEGTKCPEKPFLGQRQMGLMGLAYTDHVFFFLDPDATAALTQGPYGLKLCGVPEPLEYGRRCPRSCSFSHLCPHFRTWETSRFSVWPQKIKSIESLMRTWGFN